PAALSDPRLPSCLVGGAKAFALEARGARSLEPWLRAPRHVIDNKGVGCLVCPRVKTPGGCRTVLEREQKDHFLLPYRDTRVYSAAFIHARSSGKSGCASRITFAARGTT